MGTYGGVVAVGVAGSGSGGLLRRWSHPLKANHHDYNHQTLSIMTPLSTVDSRFSFFSFSFGPLAENFTDFVFFCFFCKSQFNHLWFGWNLSCLSVVWNFIFYPLEVSLVRAPQPIFVKSMTRYVILFHFYVSFLQKNKTKEHKIQYQIR